MQIKGTGGAVIQKLEQIHNLKADCFCKDCKEINAPEDNQLCACEREAEEEFQRSFECKGYNYRRTCSHAEAIREVINKQ